MSASTSRMKKYRLAGSVIYQQVFNIDWLVRCVRKVSPRNAIRWYPTLIERFPPAGQTPEQKTFPPVDSLQGARAVAEGYARLHHPREATT